MGKQIDWTLAPGATHWGPEVGRYMEAFYILEDGEGIQYATAGLDWSWIGGKISQERRAMLTAKNHPDWSLAPDATHWGPETEHDSEAFYIIAEGEEIKIAVESDGGWRFRTCLDHATEMPEWRMAELVARAPDWSLAPKGATHYLPGARKWFKQDHNAHEWSCHQWQMIGNDLGEFRWAENLIASPAFDTEAPVSKLPDWSKAPEGATHFDAIDQNFLRVVGETILLRSGGMVWIESPHSQYGLRIGDCPRALIMRPAELPEVAAPWIGEGLPPIGTTCEIAASSEYVTISHPEGTVVKVYATFTDDRGVDLAAFVDAIGQVGGVATARCFRPARTPEQIAADKREAAAIALFNVTNNGDERYSWECSAEWRRDDFRKAIDAGWAKVGAQ